MEVAIKKMIDTSQRIIRINGQGEEFGGGINPAMKRHLLGISRSKTCLEMQWRYLLGKRAGWDLNPGPQLQQF